MNNESTQNIVPIKDATVDVREIIGEVYDALTEKGYNPVSQVVGYIMSGDPTYITSYKNARSQMGQARLIGNSQFFCPATHDTG